MKGGFQKGFPKGGGKGWVKGDMDKGKGKGGKAGDLWNYFPSGKGYQGVCWKCHQVGHKANECTATGVNEMQGTEVEKTCGSVEVGRIWNICHVETKNRFHVLQEDSEKNIGAGGEMEGNAVALGRGNGKWRKR